MGWGADPLRISEQLFDVVVLWLQCRNLLYLFIGGTTGVLVWKM